MKNLNDAAQRNFDLSLMGMMKVQLEDINNGVSGFSRGETVRVSTPLFKRMAELAIKQIELEN